VSSVSNSIAFSPNRQSHLSSQVTIIDCCTAPNKSHRGVTVASSKRKVFLAASCICDYVCYERVGFGGRAPPLHQPCVALRRELCKAAAGTFLTEPYTLALAIDFSGEIRRSLITTHVVNRILAV
jgi:hypothetical protein